MCGKTAAKTAMKNHVIKDHNDGDENCFLINAEGAYNKDYWLFFQYPLMRLSRIWINFCVKFGANAAVT